jgi:hypothetical protein
MPKAYCGKIGDALSGTELMMGEGHQEISVLGQREDRFVEGLAATVHIPSRACLRSHGRTCLADSCTPRTKLGENPINWSSVGEIM